MTESSGIEHASMDSPMDQTDDPVNDQTNETQVRETTGGSTSAAAPAIQSEPSDPPSGTASATSSAPSSTVADATVPPAPVSPFPLPDLRETAQPDEDSPERAEFTTVYDILDKLEAQLTEAKAGFFTPSQVKVDRDEFEADLDDLKRMLPVQLERASALMREAERRLESAQTQANAIVASAQSRAADMIKDANDQAQFLAGQENVTELARQKARQILDTAQAKADHLTHGADDYSTKVMEALRQQLNKMGRDVDAGLNVLYERQKTAAEQLPHLEPTDYPEA